MYNVSSNRLPLILAIALHVIIFLALFIHFADTDTRNIQLQPDVAIIKAVAVNPADVAAQLTQIKAEEQQKQREAEEAALKLQQAEQQKQAKAAAQQKAAQEAQKQAQQKAEAAALLAQQQAEQKVLQQKQAQQAALQKQQAEKAAEAKKATEAKAAQEEVKKQQLAKKEAEKKQQQKAAQELKLAQQKALQNQMAAEQKQLEAAKTEQQQSEIDKFTALILNTMQNNWLKPEGFKPGISCQLAIHLNPDGTVVSVTLIRSSGNPAVDNSARLAVLKSSPLPVPADPDLFNKFFREFNLTATPPP
jgi:colicin import membrane protein